ncbi:MAG: phosphonate ABC transporter, permease protein PhnE [Turicibacter sp.]|nr:phosphonate ABC transporter, permease protein PhnE [Turicibacter sp.]
MHQLLNAFKPTEITLPNGKKVLEPKSPVLLYVLLVLALTFFFIELTGFNLQTIQRRGHQFFVLLENMFPPNGNYAPSVWVPLIDTVKMSLLGTFIGAMISIPFALLASTNITKSKFLILFSRFLFSLIRTIPTLVTALVATFILGFGTTAGTVAIALFTFGFVGKLLYEQIETVDMGAYEAVESMGGNKSRAFAVAIIPQVMPRFLSNTLFCFEGNVRHAAILGMVGAGGIGLIFNTQLALRNYGNVGMILMMMFAVVFIIEVISRFTRSKLV